MDIISRLLNSVVFWAAWIIIPVMMEIVPSLGSVMLLFKRHFGRRKGYEKPTIYPEISLIVPVYNSEQTLFACIKSIVDCDYPNDRIRVFLVNNKGKDNSFAVYARCQKEFPDLPMQWLNSQQGKSKALNLALYNSSGKYIINLDSDGMLEPSALTNMVNKFEANPELNCMTGAILTTPEQIEEYKGFFSRLLRKLEFMEYAQAFLAGRSYASEVNGVYTLSGAFSAFRKSVVLKSQLYNTDTICEDTQITFQMKYFYKERVEICEDAIYFVDPIEGVNKLYTQRQRWQRGSLEVAKMFSSKKFFLRRIFKDINIKTLLYDHTFAFPRMIWYLALICLVAMNYSGKAILYATVAIFLMYIIIGYFYFCSTQFFLKGTPEIRKYYCRQWWVVLLLPLFNMTVFFIRVAGIINSINTDSAWKTRDLTDERKAFTEILKSDSKKLRDKLNVVRRFINNEDVVQTAPEVNSEELKQAEAKIQEVNSEILKQETSETQSEKNCKSAGWYVCVGLVYLISILLIVVCNWVDKTYGVGLNELISTLTLTVKGTSSDVIGAALKSCLPPVILTILLVAGMILFDRKFRPFQKSRWKRVLQNSVTLGAVLVFFSGIFFVNHCFGIVEYFKTSVASSRIYEDYYVNPEQVAITGAANTKNLIYIYIESLETTYAATSDGGAQPINYIPNLTRLAGENISFSDSDKLGGFHSTYGTGITMGALFGTTSGVPYSLATEAEDMLAQGEFMPGIMTLGDVLEEKGYRQMFLCGSDGNFGGRKTYFERHGNYEVFDLFSARAAGYIPDDYFVWWGFEDKILYEIAKEKVSEMAKEDGPFNFTMLTVDPHHIDGYICDECKNEYSSVTANVMACTDNLLNEFVTWCRQQEFFEDTVIIISGDHPRMDTSLVEGQTYYDRTIYNCFINSANEGDYREENRVFTPMDMFPTILSAMGYSIEGDRLGLGTNLFSEKETLAEKKGFEWMDAELSKFSDYYYDEFVAE